MAISFAAALGIHDKALAVHSQRAELLANNMVNADTPGYKARDIDFKQMLRQRLDEVGEVTLKATHAGHLSVGTGLGGAGELMYRTPTQPSIDGNTVDLQIEQAEFAKNALRFQTSFTFLDSKIRGLSRAIKGE
jgi:flagellar basal-body rod protein FlgB